MTVGAVQAVDVMLIVVVGRGGGTGRSENRGWGNGMGHGGLVGLVWRVVAEGWLTQVG